MKTSGWTPTLAWLAAVSGAFLLAYATPNESSVMGQLPTFSTKRLDQHPLVLPAQLPAERTLVLVAYRREQRPEIESWIQGLNLRGDTGIPWVRMPVLDDPGSEQARHDIESRLLSRHTTEADRARLVPVFTNREAFIRAAGLSGPEHASVLVLDREGRVLARVEGPYDADRAQALRQTLKLTRG